MCVSFTSDLPTEFLWETSAGLVTDCSSKCLSCKTKKLTGPSHGSFFDQRAPPPRPKKCLTKYGRQNPIAFFCGCCMFDSVRRKQGSCPASITEITAWACGIQSLCSANQKRLKCIQTATTIFYCIHAL